MATTLALRTESCFKTVDSFDDLLGGKTYIMLGENVMVYKDQQGKYVVFTIDPQASYTVDDFIELPEGAPFELQNGKLICMSSPKDYHQEVSLNLAAALHYFVKSNKLGVIREAPYDVHLDNKNIFQPYILFLSNERMNRKKDWIYGAPDMVVEIISKGTESIDRKIEFRQYEEHGELEYWLVDLGKSTIEVYISEGKKFTGKKVFTAADTIISKVVQGFEIPVSEIFDTAA